MGFQNTNKHRLLAFVLALSLCTGCATIQQPQVARPVEVYFSPDDHVSTRIIRAIDKVKSSIDLAIFDFTFVDLKDALIDAKRRGVNIRIIADSRQAKGPHSVVPALSEDGFSLKITRGRHGGIMHNKFAIFDKNLLFTGSYNWTDNAERRNYENALFTSDIGTIQRYQKEFDKIWLTED